MRKLMFFAALATLAMINVCQAADEKKVTTVDKVCADDCYSHCASRVAQKLTANIPGCQRSCKRTHNCSS
ncbi:MAG TPA: hypothetical protein VMH91_01375 [Candidatus Paceibacterota bacterium]|nr:hypothetical protein [Candidatus Paceibacterota bacterium]